MDVLATLRSGLADRYTIERELGQGGMATVYLARDLKHDRQVALKVLRPELAASLGLDRFLLEIKTTAQLTHPHILPLLDSGGTGEQGHGGTGAQGHGFLYYVMPYVEGESLRQRLSREKQLPLDDALQLTREVADALSYAHSRGVVHRDIKPENILLQSGHAVVADFGIAKAIAAAGSARLTETGLSIGTPAYMSPEQAAGSGDVDGRSDLYSLGCVLYEMLAGEPPFTGPSAQAVVAKRLSTPAPRVSILRNTVPAHVEQALTAVLALAPADRYATAERFMAVLGGAASARESAAATTVFGQHRTMVRTGAVVGAALVVAAVAWFASARSGSRGAVAPEPLRAVAVLPFTYRGDSAQAYLADGFTEAVIDGLVRVEGLGVPSAGRVQAYRERDAREAGRALGVPKVVTGSVQVVGSQVRVRAQLVNVDDGTVVWALTPSNGGVADVFAMQEGITAGIVAELVPRLAASTGAALGRRMRPRDMRAYELYVKARQATYGLAPAGLSWAITALEEAVRRDSTFADAWVALADAYSMSYLTSEMSSAELAGRWRRAVERGIELDRLNGWAYSLLGYLRMQYDWDWEGARHEMRQAVRLSPASADVAINYAVFLEMAGELDSALAQMRRAVALDSTNAFMVMNLSTRFLVAGMLDSAVAAAERSLAMDSATYYAHRNLAELFLATGRRAEAEREIARFWHGAGDAPDAYAQAARLYASAGRADSARAMLQRLEGLGRLRHVESVYVAGARLAVGDRLGALAALEEAVRNHDLGLLDGLEASFEALNGEPRYEAVRQQVFGNRPAPRSIFRRAPGHPTRTSTP